MSEFIKPEVGKLYYFGNGDTVVEVTEVTKRSVVFKREGQFSHARQTAWTAKAAPYWPTP